MDKPWSYNNLALNKERLEQVEKISKEEKIIDKRIHKEIVAIYMHKVFKPIFSFAFVYLFHLIFL